MLDNTVSYLHGVVPPRCRTSTVFYINSYDPSHNHTHCTITFPLCRVFLVSAHYYDVAYIWRRGEVPLISCTTWRIRICKAEANLLRTCNYLLTNVWKRMLQSFKLGLSVQEQLMSLSFVRDVHGSVKPVSQLQCLDSPYMSFYDPGENMLERATIQSCNALCVRQTLQS